MHASTHTLDRPAITWRRARTCKTAVPRRELAAIARPTDYGSAPAIGAPHPDPGRDRAEIGHALEFACFVGTLGAIALLEVGMLAFLA